MLVSHRNRKRIACIALIFSLSVVLIICMSPAFPAGSVYAWDGYLEDCDFDGLDDETGAPVPWYGYDATHGDTIPSDWDGVAGSYNAKHEDSLKRRRRAAIQAAIPGVIRVVIPAAIRAAIPATIRAAVPEVIRAAVPEVIRAAVPEVIRAAVPEVIPELQATARPAQRAHPSQQARLSIKQRAQTLQKGAYLLRSQAQNLRQRMRPKKAAKKAAFPLPSLSSAAL